MDLVGVATAAATASSSSTTTTTMSNRPRSRSRKRRNQTFLGVYPPAPGHCWCGCRQKHKRARFDLAADHRFDSSTGREENHAFGAAAAGGKVGSVRKLGITTKQSIRTRRKNESAGDEDEHDDVVKGSAQGRRGSAGRQSAPNLSVSRGKQMKGWRNAMCHHDKTRVTLPAMFCAQPDCKTLWCSRCLAKWYDITSTSTPPFVAKGYLDACPKCRDVCTCAKCRRQRQLAQTGTCEQPTRRRKGATSSGSSLEVVDVKGNVRSHEKRGSLPRLVIIGPRKGSAQAANFAPAFLSGRPSSISSATDDDDDDDDDDSDQEETVPSFCGAEQFPRASDETVAPLTTETYVLDSDGQTLLRRTSCAEGYTCAPGGSFSELQEDDTITKQPEDTSPEPRRLIDIANDDELLELDSFDDMVDDVIRFASTDDDENFMPNFDEWAVSPSALPTPALSTASSTSSGTPSYKLSSSDCSMGVVTDTIKSTEVTMCGAHDVNLLVNQDGSGLSPVVADRKLVLLESLEQGPSKTGLDIDLIFRKDAQLDATLGCAMHTGRPNPPSVLLLNTTPMRSQSPAVVNDGSEGSQVLHQGNSVWRRGAQRDVGFVAVSSMDRVDDVDVETGDLASGKEQPERSWTPGTRLLEPNTPSQAGHVDDGGARDAMETEMDASWYAPVTSSKQYSAAAIANMTAAEEEDSMMSLTIMSLDVDVNVNVGVAEVTSGIEDWWPGQAAV